MPPFANQDWEPFSRDAVVAVALREWRMFGQPVDDDPPGTRPPPLPWEMPERQAGFWQRVGEYWWIGLDPGTPEASYTGKHDAEGAVFRPIRTGPMPGQPPLSLMSCGSPGRPNQFPYSQNHSTYINAAISGAPGLAARRPETYAPQPGDLICTGRGSAAAMRFADLPTAGSFPSHCDIVVRSEPGQLTVIGGNVDDAVTAKHVPTTPNGMLATPEGVVIDTRYTWFVVLVPAYQPPEPMEVSSR